MERGRKCPEGLEHFRSKDPPGLLSDSETTFGYPTLSK